MGPSRSDHGPVGLERAPCGVCGAREHDVLFESGDRRHPLPGTFAMVRCRACRHVYLNPRPDSETLSRYYPEDYSPHRPGGGWQSRLTQALRQTEARSLARILPPGARLLEVGCAAGDLLEPLRARGVDAIGVELSPHAAAAAKAKGLTVHCGVLADIPLEQDRFDAIVMRAVIEHVPDPLGDLGRAHTLLKPGGLILLGTDNYASLDRRVFGPDWYGFDVPRHFNLFTADSLGALLRRAGFTTPVVRYSLVPTHWIVSLRYRLERRISKSSLWSILLEKNPLALAAFLPLTFAQRLLGNGGRMWLTSTRRTPTGR
jgi:SAM-dependent methyltransferase